MMLKSRKLGTTVRQSFSKIEAATEMPNLIEVQKDSYEWFLREGLNEVLRDVSPIVDYTGNLSIEFTDYSIDPNPRYSVEECKDRSVTYDAHMKVGVRLIDKSTGEIKNSEIFLGDFPLMTDNGTFVINGAERVIVSQLVRSPGMYYGDEVDKQGKHNYSATVIPYRGAWLEYEQDSAGIFYVKIDKNRKLPISILIRALCEAGRDSDDAILEMFGDEELLRATMAKDECNALALENNTSFRDEALKEIYKKLRPGEPPHVESAEILVNNMFFDPKRYDIAAYIWPAYTGDEPRTRIFWPEGMGEWQTVRDMKPLYPGHAWPRRPRWGYVNEADPYVMEMEIEAAASTCDGVRQVCAVYPAEKKKIVLYYVGEATSAELTAYQINQLKMNMNTAEMPASQRSEKAETVAENIALTQAEHDYLMSRQVRVESNVLPVVHYALQQNKIPVVRSISIVNNSDEPLENIQLVTDQKSGNVTHHIIISRSEMD